MILMYVVPMWRTELCHMGTLSGNGQIGRVDVWPVDNITELKGDDRVAFITGFTWLGVGFGRYPIMGSWNEVEPKIKKLHSKWYKKNVK